MWNILSRIWWTSKVVCLIILMEDCVNLEFDTIWNEMRAKTTCWGVFIRLRLSNVCCLYLPIICVLILLHLKQNCHVFWRLLMLTCALFVPICGRKCIILEYDAYLLFFMLLRSGILLQFHLLSRSFSVKLVHLDLIHQLIKRSFVFVAAIVESTMKLDRMLKN